MKEFLKKNIVLIFAIIYLLFPIDLIPDSLPLIGIIDDTSLLVIDLIKRYVKYKQQRESSSTQ